MATSPESTQIIVHVVCEKTLLGLGTDYFPDYCFVFETITGNLTIKLLTHKMVSVTVA